MKKGMNKPVLGVVLIALVLTAMFAFTACAPTTVPAENSAQEKVEATATEANEPASDATGEAAQASDPYVMGFCNYAVSNSWQTQMEAEFKYAAEALKEQGVLSDYYVTNADGDVSKQIADFKDLVTKGCDAIIITAASSSALAPVCEEAGEEGVVVISFDSLVDTDDISGKVICDDKEFGRIGAQFIIDELGGKGDVAVLNGIPGSTCSDNRWAGAQEVFSQYPDIKIVSETPADWDYAKAKVAVEALLSSNQNVDAIWSQGGAMTQAAVDAYNEADKQLIPMSGEGSNGFLGVWKENLDKGFTSVCPWYPTYISVEAMNQALKVLNGEEIEPMYVLPSNSITEADIDKYYNPDLPDSYWVITNLNEEQIKTIFQ